MVGVYYISMKNMDDIFVDWYVGSSQKDVGKRWEKVADIYISYLTKEINYDKYEVYYIYM